MTWQLSNIDYRTNRENNLNSNNFVLQHDSFLHLIGTLLGFYYWHFHNLVENYIQYNSSVGVFS